MTIVRTMHDVHVNQNATQSNIRSAMLMTMIPMICSKTISMIRPNNRSYNDRFGMRFFPVCKPSYLMIPGYLTLTWTYSPEAFIKEKRGESAGNNDKFKEQK